MKLVEKGRLGDSALSLSLFMLHFDDNLLYLLVSFFPPLYLILLTVWRPLCHRLSGALVLVLKKGKNRQSQAVQ